MCVCVCVSKKDGENACVFVRMREVREREGEREFVYRLRSATQHLIATDIVSVLFCTVICMRNSAHSGVKIT